MTKEMFNISPLNQEYSTILVIPCYNEELRINEGAYLEFLTAHKDYLLIFVDDGSTDNTRKIIERVISKTDNLVVVACGRNTGKGAAVRVGILHALNTHLSPYIGFADADLSTPLVEFGAFQEEMERNERIAIVLGSRVQMLGKNIRRNLIRHWIGRVIATIICKVLDEPVYDTQCGAKLFSRKAASELFREPFLSKWLFDVEVLARHKNMQGKELFRGTVIEVPLDNWTEKENSKLRYGHIFRILMDLRKIKKHYF
jgi:dolichyl-phosphate beta-glucosyltransferase